MNILVTGAGKGIGLELVKKYSQLEGHTVYALTRDITSLKSLPETTKSKIIPIQFDLTGEPFAERFEKAVAVSIRAASGKLDILVNNAAILTRKSFEEMEEREVKLIFQTNYFAVVSLIKQLLPYMGKPGLGHIVNISSMGGYQGSDKFPGMWAYSSSKAALTCLSECLAVEFKERNIRVNCLALGSAQTSMLEKAFPGYKSPVSASEMAEFIAEFSLKGHFYFNGKVLPISLSTP